MDTNKQLSIILVAEDSDTVQIIRNTLQKVDPYAILEIVSGPDQLVSILDRATIPFFDIMLLDLKQEGELNGPLVANLIRSHQCTRLMPIIALASQEEYQTAMASHQSRINSYMRKPESLDDWAKMLKLFTDYWKATLLSVRVLIS